MFKKCYVIRTYILKINIEQLVCNKALKLFNNEYFKKSNEEDAYII